MYNVTWWSIIFSKNLISSYHSDSEKSLMLKIQTYINAYIHTPIHAYIHSSKFRNRCVSFAVTSSFLSSWLFAFSVFHHWSWCLPSSWHFHVNLPGVHSFSPVTPLQQMVQMAWHKILIHHKNQTARLLTSLARNRDSCC